MQASLGLYSGIPGMGGLLGMGMMAPMMPMHGPSPSAMLGACAARAAPPIAPLPKHLRAVTLLARTLHVSLRPSSGAPVPFETRTADSLKWFEVPMLVYQLQALAAKVRCRAVIAWLNWWNTCMLLFLVQS
jgi:hypothetical protein